MEASTTRRKAAPAKAATKGKIVVEMSEFDRETKNAFRFQEDLPKGKDRGDVGTVYVLKAALEKAGIDFEAGIKVTIEQLPDEE